MATAVHLANHLDANARPHPLFQQPQHGTVSDPYVIDLQLPLGALDECHELLAGVGRAHHQLGTLRLVELPLGITIEQLSGGGHDPRILCGHAKAAGALHIEVREIESSDKQFFAVNQHHLTVIAD